MNFFIHISGNICQKLSHKTETNAAIQETRWSHWDGWQQSWGQQWHRRNHCGAPAGEPAAALLGMVHHGKSSDSRAASQSRFLITRAGHWRLLQEHEGCHPMGLTPPGTFKLIRRQKSQNKFTRCFLELQPGLETSTSLTTQLVLFNRHVKSFSGYSRTALRGCFQQVGTVFPTDLRPDAIENIINLFLSLIIHFEVLTGTLGTPIWNYFCSCWKKPLILSSSLYA